MEHLSYQRKVTIMSAIIVCMFFSTINQTIVGVALPRIIAQLGGMDYYTWVITIYLLTTTIATILAGKLSDIYGRKYFILAGILIFMGGAFLDGTAEDIIHLIIYRGFQGIGAGIIMATAFTAIGDLFSPRERGRWAGLMSAVFGGANVLGPGLGGYIVDHFQWHWVFWIFLPLGLVAFLMILILFPRVKRQKAQHIDFAGSILLTLTIVPLLLGFSWAGTKYAWTSPEILGLFGFTLAALALFLFAETKAKTPVLPLSLFKDSIVVISNSCGFMMFAAMMGALMFMPFFVQGVMGISPTYAGYVTMPTSIGMFALSAYAGRRMTKTGKYKKMVIVGMCLIVAGMMMMIFMKNIPVAVISMIIFGAGLGLSMPVFMISVQNVVDSKDLGVATASVQLFRNLGGTIGIAVFGTVLYSNMGYDFNLEKVLTANTGTAASAGVETLRNALAASLSHVFLAGTIVLAAALVLTFLLKEIPLRTTVRKESELTESEKERCKDCMTGELAIGAECPGK